jgi:peptidoglycan/xylan/chitin deacetylase (PgdA/CDA1 family)
MRVSRTIHLPKKPLVGSFYIVLSIVFIDIILIAYMLLHTFYTMNLLGQSYQEEISVWQASYDFTVGNDVKKEAIFQLKSNFALGKNYGFGEDIGLIKFGEEYKKIIDHKMLSQSNRYMALTFDDGPSKRTDEILEILDHNEVKATFFLLATETIKYPKVVKEIAQKGHEIESHSYSHLRLTKTSGQQLLRECIESTELIERIAGVKIKYLRPPYGAYNKDLINFCSLYNLQLVTWNVDPRDWEKNKAEDIIEDIVKQVQQESVVILHDNKPATIQALPKIITLFKKQGYQFLTVEELIEKSQKIKKEIIK